MRLNIHCVVVTTLSFLLTTSRAVGLDQAGGETLTAAALGHGGRCWHVLWAFCALGCGIQNTVRIVLCCCRHDCPVEHRVHHISNVADAGHIQSDLGSFVDLPLRAQCRLCCRSLACTLI